MAGRTLKVDIYVFQLYKIKEVKERMYKGQTTYYTIKEETPYIFQDFFAERYPKEAEKFEKFFENFVNRFSNRFRPNAERTRALSILKNSFKPKKDKNIIEGCFIGGSIGIPLDIYKENSANEVRDTISPNDVVGLKYYYKLWMAPSSNLGILMVQGYTTESCATLLKDELGLFFKSLDAIVSWEKKVPTDTIDKFINNSNIYKAQIIRKQPNNSISNTNTLFEHVKNARLSEWVTKLNIPMMLSRTCSNFKADLRDYIVTVMDTPISDEDSIILYYTSPEGDAHASLKTIEDIIPNITLPPSLKKDNSDIPNWEKLSIFMDGILLKIQKQIKYIPEKDE